MTLCWWCLAPSHGSALHKNTSRHKLLSCLMNLLSQGISIAMQEKTARYWFFFLIQSCTVWFPVWAGLSKWIHNTHNSHMPTCSTVIVRPGYEATVTVWTHHTFTTGGVLLGNRGWSSLGSRCFAVYKTHYRNVLVAVEPTLLQHGGQQLLDSHHHQHFSSRCVHHCLPCCHGSPAVLQGIP